MRIIFLINFVFVTVFCFSQKKTELFLCVSKQLVLKKIIIKEKAKLIQLANAEKMLIHLPELRKTNFSFLEKKIIDTVTFFFSNCNNPTDYYTKIAIKHLTDSLISMDISCEVRCKNAPMDFTYTIVLNYLFYNNKFYEIRLNSNIVNDTAFINLIKKSLGKECSDAINYSLSDEFRLFFERYIVFIDNISYDKTCLGLIKLPLFKKYFEFLEVNVKKE